MHIVNTGLKPGYNEYSEIILHASFSVFTEFLELDYVRSNSWRFDGYKLSWKEKYIPWLRYKAPANAKDLVIKFLNEDVGTSNTGTAKEMLELYTWWINRPNRNSQLKEVPDYDDQGLGDFAMINKSFDKTAPDYVAYRKAIDYNHNLTDSWEKEDTDMLVRLAVIRQTLWT